MKDIASLLNMCLTQPVDFNRIEAEIKREKYSVDQITLCAIKYTRKCFCEYGDFVIEKGRMPILGELLSDRLFELVSLLLRYGLNPNSV